MEQTKHSAVFIDRDGTLNVEKDYVHKIEDFEFIPGAKEAIRLLNDNQIKVIVISNQSGIARGYYTPNDVHLLHDYIQRELRKEKAQIDAFFYCPHHPDGTVDEFRKICDCRKPAPGMLLQAEQKLNIDLQSSYVIGDNLSDIKLQEEVPVKTILVRTGHGNKALEELQKKKIRPDRIEENLLDAVNHIIRTTIHS
ncbi:D-glycero-beta-D-manno-heptose 1,7-bisphosphate 7-phosphatase [bacterium]|nr:D-glycero-beta-D-manno-heptose 1,7-bisphosphate 7-phosphatase [bacterium]